MHGRNGQGQRGDPQKKKYPYDAERLTYRLAQVDTDGVETPSGEVTVRWGVEQAELRPPFPNPARTRATVRYAAPEGAEVTLRLYDVLGRVVQAVARRAEAGRVEEHLDVSRLPSGVYFLRMQAGREVVTRRMTVVR